MTKHTLSGAAIAMLVAMSVPAFAFTHHPSTPRERAQTRDLNLQQLALAKGQAPSDMQANAGTTSNEMNNTAPAQSQPTTPDESSQPLSPQTPAPDNNAKPQTQTPQ